MHTKEHVQFICITMAKTNLGQLNVLLFVKGKGKQLESREMLNKKELFLKQYFCVFQLKPKKIFAP